MASRAADCLHLLGGRFRLHILGCGTDQGRNLVDLEFACRHCVYKFVDNLIRKLRWCLAVELEEYRSSEPPETFVAVDERMSAWFFRMD